MSVSEIFLQKGESSFRQMEKNLCSLLSMKKKLVIATGGGTLLNNENLDKISAYSVIFCLEASPYDIQTRLKDGSGRPLFTSGWLNIFEKRKHIYETLGISINTSGRSPAQVAGEILMIWKKMEVKFF